MGRARKGVSVTVQTRLAIPALRITSLKLKPSINLQLRSNSLVINNSPSTATTVQIARKRAALSTRVTGRHRSLISTAPNVISVRPQTIDIGSHGQSRWDSAKVTYTTQLTAKARPARLNSKYAKYSQRPPRQVGCRSSMRKIVALRRCMSRAIHDSQRRELFSE